MSISSRVTGVILLMVSVAFPVAAGFAGTDVILPIAGRVTSGGGVEWYTTGWITNPGDRAVDVQFQFLPSGGESATATDTIAPGETKTYENLTETLFHITGTLGAVRARCTSPVLMSARLFSLPAGATASASQGVYFARCPGCIRDPACRARTASGGQSERRLSIQRRDD